MIRGGAEIRDPWAPTPHENRSTIHAPVFGYSGHVPRVCPEHLPHEGRESCSEYAKSFQKPEAVRDTRDPRLTALDLNANPRDAAVRVLLAAGASPAMVHAKEEAGEFAGIASAVTINIGTLSPDWLAGMKAGVYPGPDEFSKKWALDRRFEPTMAENERDRRYAAWKEAVKATMSVRT